MNECILKVSDVRELTILTKGLLREIALAANLLQLLKPLCNSIYKK